MMMFNTTVRLKSGQAGGAVTHDGVPCLALPAHWTSFLLFRYSLGHVCLKQCLKVVFWNTAFEHMPLECHGH